jgi:ParB/RepB/Spo0J family partition protein
MSPKGNFENVTVARLRLRKKDLRNRRDPEYLNYFHQVFVPSIERDGVLVPILCTRDGDFRNVEDGMTRVFACLHLQIAEIPAMVYDPFASQADADIAAAQTTLKRRAMSEIEKAMFFIETMNTKKWTQVELSRNLDIPPYEVSRAVKPFKTLPEDLQTLIGSGKGKIPLRAANALAMLPDHDMMREWGKNVISEAWCVEHLEGAVRDFLGGKKPRKPRDRTIKDGKFKLTCPADIPDADLADWLAQQARKLKKTA